MSKEISKKEQDKMKECLSCVLSRKGDSMYCSWYGKPCRKIKKLCGLNR